MVKRNYIKDLLRHGYFILALLITSVAMTGIVASYEFGLFGALMSINGARALLIVGLIVCAVVGGIYLIMGLKFKKQSVADSVYLAITLIGIVFLFYFLIALKTPNARRILFAIALIVIGGILSFIRIWNYEHADSHGKFNTDGNHIKQYFAELFNKFSFASIVVAFVVLVCFAHLVLNSTFAPILKDTATLIISAICVIPLIVYGVLNAKDRDISPVDALAFAALLALPVVLAMIFVLYYSPLRVIVWAVIFGALIVFIFLRLVTYGSVKGHVRKTFSANNYFQKVFAKHDPLLSLSIGALIALVALVTLSTRSFQEHLLDGASVGLVLKSVPIAVVLVSAVGALVLFAIVTLLGCKNKNVGIVDFFLANCVSFIIFGYLTLIAHPSPILLYLLSAFLVYCIIITVVRVKSTK